MDRVQKRQVVEALSEAFSNTSVLLIDFTGISVADETDLRRKIAESGGYRVVKNTLALRACKDTPVASLGEHFQGPTAIAFSESDPVALAKAVTDFAKAHPTLEVKAGVLEGNVLTPDQIRELANLPSRTELLSKVLYLLQAPLTQLAAALKSPLFNLGSLLRQVADQKSE